jgi:tetratricopeptide (TPR) repeat protein
LLLLSSAACASKGPSRAAVARAPTPLRARLAHADAVQRAGDDDRAAALYEAIVSERPEWVPAHLRLVSNLSSRGLRRRARDLYEARAARPAATDADRTMAERLSGDGSDDDLRRVYSSAVRRAPGNAWWRLALAEIELGVAQESLARATDGDAAGDGARAQKERAAARTALADGTRHLDEAARLDPSLPETSLYRGLALSLGADLARGGEARRLAHEEAAAAFARASTADPELVEAWIGLGDAKSRAGKDGEALLAYVRALRLAPSDPDLRESAARVLRSLDRPLDAAEQYHAAAVLRPRSAAPLVALGDALSEAGRSADALSAYAEALRREPTAVEAHRRAGAVYESMGRVAQARASYGEYVRQGGADADAVRRRIERLSTRGAG